MQFKVEHPTRVCGKSKSEAAQALHSQAAAPRRRSGPHLDYESSRGNPIKCCVAHRFPQMRKTDVHVNLKKHVSDEYDQHAKWHSE